MVKKKKIKRGFFGYFFLSIWFIIKIPYFIIKGIYLLFKKIIEKREARIIENKRKSFKPKYVPLKILKKIKGDYKAWFENVLNSDSQIGIILGARGTGKTAFGIKLLENIYFKNKKKCFAMGFSQKELPYWMKVVEDVSQIENDSFVLLDEGGIAFSSRNSMSRANKVLSNLMLIARHKNISIIFISQNSSNLDVNILRQADYLVLKPSSLLQKEFERKVVQKIYSQREKEFLEFKEDKGTTYIHSNKFLGFVSNPLPSFWREEISKSFK